MASSVKPETYVSNNGFGKPSHLKNVYGEWVETPHNYRLREDGFISHKYLRGKDGSSWYEVPTIDELEEMTMDVCITPSGDIVELDHPCGWLRIMGLI